MRSKENTKKDKTYAHSKPKVMITSCYWEGKKNQRKKHSNNKRGITIFLQLRLMRLKTSYAQIAISRCLKYSSFYTKIHAKAAIRTTLNKTSQFIKDLEQTQSHCRIISKICKKNMSPKHRAIFLIQAQNRHIRRKKKKKSHSNN